MAVDHELLDIEINSGDEEDPVKVLEHASRDPKTKNDQTRFTLRSDINTENSGYEDDAPDKEILDQHDRAPDKEIHDDDVDDAASNSQTDELYIWLKDNYCELVGEDHE